MLFTDEYRCLECDRVFDMTSLHDRNEWAYGHDCESV
jgi:hypothetical protein